MSGVVLGFGAFRGLGFEGSSLRRSIVRRTQAQDELTCVPASGPFIVPWLCSVFNAHPALPKLNKS